MSAQGDAVSLPRMEDALQDLERFVKDVDDGWLEEGPHPITDEARDLVHGAIALMEIRIRGIKNGEDTRNLLPKRP